MTNKPEIPDDYEDDIRENENDDTCPNCGEEYDDIDYEYQMCHLCGFNNMKSVESK